MSRNFKVLLLILLVSVLAGGLTRIGFEVDIVEMLPQQLKHVEAMKQVSQHFSQPGEMILTVEAEDPAQAKQFAESLASYLEKSDVADRVISSSPLEDNKAALEEFLAYQLLNQEPDQFAEIAKRFDPNYASGILQQSIEELTSSHDFEKVAKLSYDPLGLLDTISDLSSAYQGSEFQSPDGRLQMIYVYDSGQHGNEWVDRVWIEALAWQSSLPDQNDVVIGMTGEPVFVAEISRSMRSDMMASGAFTLVFVVLLLWLVYRNWKLLLAVVLLLVCSFAMALSAAGYLLPQLTVLSVGFASILLGLNVDYALIAYNRFVYQQNSTANLKKHLAPGILWAAATTALAFLSLNVSGIPGVAQLGTMVALGVAAGALLVLGPFVRALPVFAKTGQQHTPLAPLLAAKKTGSLVTVLWLVIAGVSLLIFSPPPLDHSSAAMRPETSIAYDTWERMNEKLAATAQPLHLISYADDPETIRKELIAAEEILGNLKDQEIVEQFLTPLPIWPSEQNLAANRQVVLGKIDLEALKDEFIKADFNIRAFTLTGNVMGHWSSKDLGYWTNPDLTWSFRHITDYFWSAALGVVEPVDGVDHKQAEQRFSPEPEHTKITSAVLLGDELAEFAKEGMLRVLAAFSLVTVIMLRLALGSWRNTLLAIVSLGCTAMLLLGTMSLTGIQWNFLNLGAGLLLLGTSIDFSIHLLRALESDRQDNGNAASHISSALFLCALTTIVGFASIGFADNRGLASLGQVCAIGHAANLLVSLYLLPVLYRFVKG